MLTGFSLSVLALSALVTSGEGGGSLIDVNPGLIFWTFITFIVLAVILKVIGWKPFLNALDQRELAIKEALEKADRAQEEARKVLDENKASIAVAEEESKKIINQSREYAEKMKEQMIQDSREQAKKIVDDASKEIESKKEAAFEDLKNQVAEIAVQAAEKIMRENLDNEAQKKIANKFIGEITKN